MSLMDDIEMIGVDGAKMGALLMAMVLREHGHLRDLSEPQIVAFAEAATDVFRERRQVVKNRSGETIDKSRGL